MFAPAAALFRSLADPSRLAIVRRLAAGEARVTDLAAELGLAQSTISAHLACLRDCDLVQSRPAGRASWYSLSRPELLDLLAAGELLRGLPRCGGKRLELLDLLAQAERSIGSLAGATGLRLTTASAHLHVRKHAGLVATRRDGTRIFCRLACPDVTDLYARTRDVAAAHLADVTAAATPTSAPRHRGNRNRPGG